MTIEANGSQLEGMSSPGKDIFVLKQKTGRIISSHPSLKAKTQLAARAESVTGTQQPSFQYATMLCNLYLALIDDHIPPFHFVINVDFGHPYIIDTDNHEYIK
ncbi:hypothetical protein TNCV_2155421 [Trichonephila clavipes]|nr:hypothetical protein TNCV_2155421 [Trichonephila clavipes]